MSNFAYLKLRDYLLAVLAVVAALILMLLLNPWVSMAQSPFLIFFGAVMVSAWWGGLKPGCVATALSAFLSAAFFLPPADSLMLDLSDTVRTGIFIVQGLLFSILCQTLRETNHQLTGNVQTLRQTEADLQDALQKLMFHVENSPLAVVEWDREYRVARWSPRAESIFGWQAAEILGKRLTDWQFVHPEDAADVEQVISRLMSGIEDRNWICNRNYTKTGAIVYCEWYSSALLDETGQFVSAFCLVLDVTARIQAEQAVQASEAQFRLVTNAVPSLIGYVDQNQHYRFVNQSYADWFGQTAEALIGQPVCSVVGDTVYRNIQSYVEFALSGQQVNFESEMFNQAGELRYLDITYVPDFSDFGKVNGYISLSIDVTARKQAELALQAANRRTTNILESISDAFVAFDRQWVCTYVNETAAKLLQKPPKALLEHQIWHVYPELLNSLFYSEMQRAAAEQIPVAFEAFFPVFHCWLEVNIYPAAEGISVYFRNITERKQSETTLRQSEERLRLALDVGKAGVWDWEISSNRVTWSDRIYQFHGLSRDTFDSTVEATIAMVHPDDRGLVSETMHQTLENQSTFEIEFRIIRPTGEIRWLSTTGGVVLDSSGTPSRMLGAATDITERKNAEAEREKLLQAEQAARSEAETANRMKDEFLATVSHELRSPLNAMLGWTNLLQSRQLDEATVNRALQTIERNARAQVQLIEDLLDVSRIIRGQLRLNVQPVSLVPVIEAAIDTVRLAAEAKSIRLQSVLDPLAGSVSGDPSRLQQVVWNLLSNAIKFTPKGGRIHICLQRVNSHIEIVVNDTGEGISPAFLPFVFDRFRQSDGSMTRSYSGLGLGLAIVRHLVELHGGTVQAESPGRDQGATFTVKLPLIPVNTQPDPFGRIHPTATEGLPFEWVTRLDNLRILIVDDEVDVRELLAQVLEQCGATVVTAATADAALSSLEQQAGTDPFDVLISDIGMPGENGYDLLRRIRALPPEQGGRIPAIAFTAYARAEDRRNALLAGFQAHVAKPVEPAELTAVIASLVGKLPTRNA